MDMHALLGGEIKGCCRSVGSSRATGGRQRGPQAHLTAHRIKAVFSCRKDMGPLVLLQPGQTQT